MENSWSERISSTLDEYWWDKFYKTTDRRPFKEWRYIWIWQSSPVVLVSKKDGSMPLCVDYTIWTKILKNGSYPLPRIDDILEVWAGFKWFSTLDSKSGYWEVAVYLGIKKRLHFLLVMVLLPDTLEHLMELMLRGLSNLEKWHISYYFTFEKNVIILGYICYLTHNKSYLSLL